MAAIGSAFMPAFVIAGSLALLGSAALAGLVRPSAGLATIAAVAIAVPAVYAAVDSATGPAPVAIADPCQPRRLPDSGGVSGFAQDRALRALDKLACANGSSREALALALASSKEARSYERRYGVSLRTPGGLWTQAKRCSGSTSARL